MITVAFNDKKFYINFFGDNFQEIIEMLKQDGGSFNPTLKKWELPFGNFNAFMSDVKALGEVLEIDALSKKNLKDYMDSLDELKFPDERIIVDTSLMKFPPLVGKAPNENFQLEDITAALNQNRFLFNWDMGLGKSYALTCIIENLRALGYIDKCIIFTSGIGSFNLKSELTKLGINQSPDDIFVASNARSFRKREDRLIFDNDKYKTLILTYDVFKLISDAYYEKTHKGKKSSTYIKSYMPIDEWFGDKPGIILADECHLVANATSRRSHVFLQNIDKFYYRYLFTGTLADKYEKLYMPCRILDKRLVEGCSYSAWLSQYVEIGNRYSKFGVNSDTWDIDKINKLNSELTRNYASKRIMTECLDLPLNYEVPDYKIDMSELQRSIYEDFTMQSVELVLNEAQDGDPTNNLLNMFAYFQLAVDNPSCILKSRRFPEFSETLRKKIEKYDYTKDCSKLDVLDAIIEDRVDEDGQKGIIWYIHPATKDALVEKYKNRKPFVIDAGLGYEEQFRIIDEFKKSDSKLLIASLLIMNTSVTVIECKWQVYLENTYNYTIYSQSRGRIYRPGQNTTVRTYFIEYNNSIDNLQRENLRQKGMLIDSLVNKKYISQGEWSRIFNMH